MSAMADNARYMIDVALSKNNNTVLYRATKGERITKYDMWTSTNKEWRPDSSAVDAFYGVNVMSDEISEAEALVLIEKHTKKNA